MIYCYVTGEQCPILKTADIGDEINGVPVEDHGDYEAWRLDEQETNALVFSASGYRFKAGRAVQREMSWQVNYAPIRAALLADLPRKIARRGLSIDAADVLSWADAGVDEDDICRRNYFDVQRISSDLLGCYCAEREED